MEQVKSKLAFVKIFALFENWDMRRLKKWAKHGWHLEGFYSPSKYRLVFKEPLEVKYRLEYQEDLSDYFFASLHEQGWYKVANYRNIFVFQGSKNSGNVNVNPTSRIKKYKFYRIEALKTAFMALIPIVFAYFWMGRVTSDLWILITRLFTLITFIPFLIAIYQIIAYHIILLRLSKGDQDEKTS